MASINKLMIKGIRSFDPNNEATIYFYSPLTLIVGQNGAGKTTIIEALKYATTGDLPPNSKSGAFIYDPKIAQRNEITAQVRLGFENLTGKKMECLRSIMVSKKRTNYTQKTLEAVLYTYDEETNQQTSITARSSTLDSDMQLNLGVSKAVLDSVIFCHQEESNWPLSEPAVLKKKFDDIFSATRYTKALDTLKAQLKETKAEQKVLDTELKNTESNKRHYITLQNEAESNDVQIKQKTEIINNIDINLSKVEQDIEVYTTKLNERNNLLQKIADIQKELKFHTDSKRELEGTMDKLDKSREELINMKERESENLAIYEKELSVLKVEQEALVKEESSNQEKITGLKSKQGKYQAIIENFNKNIKVKDALIDEIIEVHNEDLQFRPKESFENMQKMTPYIINRLNKAISSNNSELQQMKEDCRKKEYQINAALQGLSSNQLKYSSEISNFANNINKIKEKINHNKKELGKLKEEQEEILSIKDEIIAKEEKIEAAQIDASQSNFEQEISEKSKKLDELINELYNFSNTQTPSNSSQEYQVQLRTMEINLLSAEEQLKTLKSNHRNNFEKFVNHVPMPQNAQRQVELAISVKKDQINDIKTKLIRTHKNQLTAETKLVFSKSLLERKRIELQGYNMQCNSLCNGLNYLMVLHSLDNEVDELKKKVYGLEGKSHVIDKFISKCGNESNSIGEFCLTECPLCNKAVSENGPKSSLFKEIHNEYLNSKEKTSTYQKELYPKEAKLKKLRDFLPNWELIKSINSQEIPDLESEIAVQEAQISYFNSELSKHNLDLNLNEKELDILRELSFVAKDMKKYDDIKESMSRDIKRLSNKGPNDIPTSALMNNLPQQINTLRSEIEELKQSQSKYEGLTRQYEKELYELKERQLTLNNKAQKKEQIEKEILNLEREIEELITSKQESEVELEKLAPLVERKEFEINAAHSVIDEIESKLQTKTNSYNQYLNSLTQIEKTLNQNQMQDITKQLEEIDSEEKAYSLIIKNLKDKINTKQEAINKLNSKLSNEANFEREINDNIRYLDLEEKIELFKQEIKELKKQINEEEIERFNQKLGELKENNKEYARKRARLEGEIREIQNSNIRISSKLDSTFLNALEENKAQVTKCCINELTVSDLEIYIKALDTAILKFHSIKMAEINRTIKELWVETYYGTDIETIKISSDPEKARGGRSYDYRVVMVKDGAELDMRGRCSAGQKVLTSIIIRLALAEAFGTNCGILALDEPTTNLDKQNIESLATSLANIIQARQNQKNFQLVIITHDEDFTSHLGRSNFADYYWVVKKEQSKVSTIHRNNIEDLYQDHI